MVACTYVQLPYELVLFNHQLVLSKAEGISRPWQAAKEATYRMQLTQNYGDMDNEEQQIAKVFLAAEYGARHLDLRLGV